MFEVRTVPLLGDHTAARARWKQPALLHETAPRYLMLYL